MPEIAAVQFAEYGPPDVLSLARLPAPEPRPGEVVVEVHAASVNPIDWKIRSGRLKGAFPAALPMITGRDGAGVIAAVGKGVDAARIGERVCFLAPRGVGTWAEVTAVPAELAVPIPPSLSFTDAAALPLAGLSTWAGLVTAANLQRGMRILVHAAAGGVGSLAVQIARDIGAHVAATCSHRNSDFVRSLGADQVIAYDRTAFEEVLSGLDAVFDTMGGDIHRRSYKVLRRGGVMACLSAEPYQDLSAEYGVSVRMAQVSPDADTLAQLVTLVAAGRLRPVVDRILPFTDFVQAHANSESGHARGKTVLTIKAQ